MTLVKLRGFKTINRFDGLTDRIDSVKSHVNLLPLARGILYFGCSVPVDNMAYNSRIGTMPTYSTIRRHLEGLSSEEALVTFRHGSDPTKAGILLFDNVQNLARVRDLRIGRDYINIEILSRALIHRSSPRIRSCDGVRIDHQRANAEFSHVLFLGNCLADSY
ncbi:hypothetical protein C8R44DRAFT_761740 [Mycena epipterygia]|nr:hypothetical protein C8R44DRAFT_761740 [Mycena epipterygia]